QRPLHVRATIPEGEDIGSGPDEAGIEEGIDIFRAQSLDVERPARHEMAEALDRLGRADQLARATATAVFLAGLLVNLARGGRTADRASMGHFVGLGIGRALVDEHIDDLGDDITCPLDGDRVADADILALADRHAGAVAAGDIVLVVQRHIDHGDAADADRIEPGDRGERAGAADLYFDIAHHGAGLFGRELVRHGPAWLAGDEAPAALQF